LKAVAVGTVSWTVERDGSNPTRLTTGAVGQSPDFSPDGTKIVFVRIINNTRQLFTMNPDGSAQTQVPTARMSRSASYA
jgi:TolB protein